MYICNLQRTLGVRKGNYICNQREHRKDGHHIKLYKVYFILPKRKRDREAFVEEEITFANLTALKENITFTSQKIIPARTRIQCTLSINWKEKLKKCGNKIV